MALRAVFCQQNVPENAEPVREALSSVIPDKGGVVEIGDFAVAQTTTASLAVTVAPGRIWVPGTNQAVIPGTLWSTQGQYFVTNDGTVTETVPTPDATNPRIDLVVVTIPDSAYAGSTDTATIQIIEGSPVAGASYPTNAPAAPNNSYVLAWYYVAANAPSITNANITSLIGQPCSPASFAKGLQAEVDYTSDTGLGGGGGSLYVVTSIPTFTFKANRWYEVFGHGSVHNPTANTIALLHLHTDSTGNSSTNVTGLTEIMGYNAATTIANQDYRFHLSRKIKYTSDTTLQLKLTAEPQSGGGNVYVKGGPTYPVQLGVIDLGAQF